MHVHNSAISISTKSGTARHLGPRWDKQRSSSLVLPMWLESTTEGLWAAKPLSITLCLLKGFIAWVFRSEHGTPPPPCSEIPRYFASRIQLICLMRLMVSAHIITYSEIHGGTEESNTPKSTGTMSRTWPTRLHIPLPPSSSSSHPT